MISLTSYTNLVNCSNLPFAIQSNSLHFSPRTGFEMCDALSNGAAEQVKRFVLDRGAGLQLTRGVVVYIESFVLFFSSGKLCLSPEIRDFFLRERSE